MAEQGGSYRVDKIGDKPILVHRTEEKGETLPADFQIETVRVKDKANQKGEK